MIATVRVIIPSIGRDSLGSAINSVRSQVGVAIKLIVVDDSFSQDLTVPAGVTLLRSGGLRGPSFCRNLGLVDITEDYLAFLDDDDLWFENKCHLQITEMKSKSLDATFHKARINFKSIRPKSILSFHTNPLRKIYSLDNFISRRYFLPFPSLIVTREVAQLFHFNPSFNEREDLEYLMQIYLFGFKVEQLDMVLMNIAAHRRASIARVSLIEDKRWYRYLRDNIGVANALIFLFGFTLRNRLIAKIMS